MAQNLIDAGTWPCTVLGADYGEDPDPKRAGISRVQITVRIDSGPAAGRVVTYKDDVTHRSALYIGRSCRNVGWQGDKNDDDLTTLKADCDAWIKETGGKALIEIKHLEITKGERKGQIWDKPNAIKRAAPPLKAASASTLADAREAMRAAREAEGGSEGGSEPADYAGYSNGAPATGTDVAPPIGDEDIPF